MSIMNFNIEIKDIKDLTSELKYKLNQLAQREIAVGIPGNVGNAKTRDSKGKVVDSDSSLLKVAIVHEFGAPNKNIPRRSFLISTFEENREKYSSNLTRAINDILHKDAHVNERLQRVARIFEIDVKRKFVNNDWAQVSATRLKQKTKQGKAGTSPLIDTGNLRQSIVGIVRGRGE